MKPRATARKTPRGKSDFDSLDGGVALQLASQAFAHAEYVECRHILRSASARTRAARAMLALIEARAARIEGDLDAWQTAAHLAAEHHPEPSARFEGVALRANAYRRAGKTTDAERDFDRVRQALETDSTALGMPVYYLAYDAWLRRAYDEAESLLRRNLTAGASVPMSLQLLGWTEIRRERYAKGAALFVEALQQQRASGEVDLRLQGSMLHAASNVASETVDLKLARKLKRDFDEFVWPQSLAVERFNTLTCFRFAALLEGDLQRAWILSREAVVRAPSVAYTVIGETNAAVASRLLGDMAGATVQLQRAWEMLRKQRWGSADVEARVAVSNFAIEASSGMPAEARKAMTMYDSLTARENASSLLHHDRRVRAFEAMAAGRVAEAQDDPERARGLYRTSFGLWREMQYDMRAALVALDLRRLTRDAGYDAAVEAVLARAPKAWLAKRNSPGNDVLSQITRAEMLVLAALLEGKTARAIADDLGRSVHTVNNHTRKIFKAFGVTSRAAVVARCAAFGITPNSLDRAI